MNKDPYLKPVIFGGLIIAFLSMLLPPAIFVWSTAGGFIAHKLALKFSKEKITAFDCLLISTFSGVLGGACIDVITALSFRLPENQELLIKTIEKNWPASTPKIDNLSQLLPSIFITTCILIVIITIIFSILGGYLSFFLNKKKMKN